MCTTMNSNISFDYSDTYSSTQDLCVSSIMAANNYEDYYTFKICDQSDVTIDFVSSDKIFYISIVSAVKYVHFVSDMYAELSSAILNQS